MQYIRPSGLIKKKSAYLFYQVDKQCRPDEMRHYAAFHLDLYCLQKNLFRVFLNTKG